MGENINLNNDKINDIENIIINLTDDKKVKIIKKDRGLIERAESSKTILTEDNRQLLND